jgi:hypothetical protein
VRVFLKASLNKVFGTFSYFGLTRKHNLLFYYFGEISEVPYFERNAGKENLVCQHSHTPNVDLTVVALVSHHFGRGVERSAALGAPEEGRVDCPSEVAYFYSVFMQKDVLRLNVPVDDIIFMHIL